MGRGANRNSAGVRARSGVMLLLKCGRVVGNGPPHTHIQTHTHTHAHTHARTHAHIHTRTHTRTHTHAHTDRHTEYLSLPYSNASKAAVTEALG